MNASPFLWVAITLHIHILLLPKVCRKDSGLLPWYSRLQVFDFFWFSIPELINHQQREYHKFIWWFPEVWIPHGTPTSSIFIGCSIINHPFWGIPIFGNLHMNSQGLSYLRFGFDPHRCKDLAKKIFQSHGVRPSWWLKRTSPWDQENARSPFPGRGPRVDVEGPMVDVEGPLQPGPMVDYYLYNFAFSVCNASLPPKTGCDRHVDKREDFSPFFGGLLDLWAFFCGGRVSTNWHPIHPHFSTFPGPAGSFHRPGAWPGPDLRHRMEMRWPLDILLNRGSL